MLGYNSVFTLSKPGIYMPNQNIMEPIKEELDNKRQLSQKKLQRYHVSLAALTKDLPPKTPTAAHLVPQASLRSSQASTT